MEEMVTPATTNFMLSGLDPGSVYEVSVTATNDIGRGPGSNVLKFKTGEEEPSAPPTDVSGEGVGPTSIRVSFKPPPEDKCNGQIIGFYVGYKQVSDFNKPYTYRTIPFGKFNQSYEYFLTQLKKGTDYAIRIKAYNSAGSGSDSSEIIAKTLTLELPPAPKVYLFPVTTNSVSLMWKPVVIDSLAPEAKIAGYTVHFRPDQSPTWKQVHVNIGPEGQHQEVSIKELEPNTLYHFYVTALNNLGPGDPSPIISVKTRPTDDDSQWTNGVSTTSDGKSPFSSVRLEFMSFVSITAAIVVVIVVIIISYACIKKAQLTAAKPAAYADFVAATLARHGIRTAPPPPGPSSDGGDGKSIYMGTHRYIEFDASGRPVKSGNIPHIVDAHGNMFPAPYASLSVPPHGTPAAAVRTLPVEGECISFCLSVTLF